MNKEREQQIWAEWLDARRDRVRFDLSWYVQYQWYGGETNVFLDSSRRSQEVYRVNQRGERARRVRPINLIGHAVDILVAKHMKSRPVFDAAPASMDQKDLSRARAARDWLRFFFRRERLTSRRRRLMIDRAVCGNSFAKIYYDPLRGPLTEVQQKCGACVNGVVDVDALARTQGASNAADLNLPSTIQCPACKGSGYTSQGRQPIGDVAAGIVSPWEIYVPSTAMDMDTTPTLFHAYKLPHSEAAARYGIDPDQLKPSAHLEEGDSDFAAMARANRTAGLNDRDVYVVEKHEKPAAGTEHPKITILVGDQMVWPKEGMPEHEEGKGVDSETPFGRIPFFHFRFRPNPGEFFSRGRVLDVISSNDTVNRIRHNLDTHIRKMAVAKWVAEKGSVSSEAITNEEGEVIEYTGVREPRQTQISPMPEYVRGTMKDEEDSVYKNLGISEIERGVSPPNIEAAEALATMVEQSETSHGPIYLEDADNWEQMGRSALLCAIANYKDDEERLVRVSGPGGRYEARMLSTADLSGDVDIIVELGGAVSQSLALRRADVLRFLQAGALDPARALELAEFGAPGGEFNDIDRLHESVASMESDEIEAGNGHSMIQGLDHHPIHARIHRAAALSARLAGNMQLAQALTQAAIEHEQQMVPPQPEQGGGGEPEQPQEPLPFDTSAPGVEQIVKE